jgi:hypothetical protein
VSEEQGTEDKIVRVDVDPGICGFPCAIRARREGKREVKLDVWSECDHIQRLASLLEVVSLKGLFSPLSRNPIFVSAEKARCHASCVIPVAMAKAAEVALEMALPRDVRITFEA